ncbi:Transposase DDE domain protein [Thiorhodovibrio litoralis]|nr:Transposase DDE domain protein [Thiorhodovibrio litoralis]
MYTGKLVFSQLTEHLPLPAFRQCVTRYRGNHKIKSFSCLDQFLSMMFAQLTYRESLRDIETTLRAHSSKLYHMGIRGGISRNTLANANQVRDWRIYADFTSTLIQIARGLYSNEKLALDLEQTVYAFDSSTIDLCLSVFPWAPFRRTKAGIKLHTLLDLRGNIPSFIAISDAKLNDVKALDLLTIEPGAFYIMDRAYLDFERLYRFQLAGAFFVIRAKSNTKMRRLHSRPVDKTTGLRCDQTVSLTGVNTHTITHISPPQRRPGLDTAPEFC